MKKIYGYKVTDVERWIAQKNAQRAELFGSAEKSDNTGRKAKHLAARGRRIKEGV